MVSAFLAWAVLSSVWRQVGWQNETRELFGMAPASPTAWPVIIAVAALVSVLILIVSRSLRRLFGFRRHLAGASLATATGSGPRIGGPAAAHLGLGDWGARQRLLRRGKT